VVIIKTNARITLGRFIFVLLISAFLVSAQDVPFGRGVNLSNWLQTSKASQIQFNKYTKQDLENIKTLGCDVIRLPFRLNDMTTGESGFEIDPLFLYFLDQIVDWAEELDLHLILDNHTFDVETSTSPQIVEILVPVWRNLAEHYADGYDKLYYEILNEPHGISDELWGTIQGEVINAIREVDTSHFIVVGPAGWNSYNNLQHMPEYEDEKLIYTFHFYEPFIFTHQGASWTDPSLEPLSGVPFPYNPVTMPTCPDELLGTYIESTIANYQSEGTFVKLAQQVLVAAQFANVRNVPIFCGEFGVYIPQSPADDRVYWYNKVRNLFESYNIAWTTWDYQGGFGLFEANTPELFNYDLNLPLLDALGLNQPIQYEFEIKPDSIGIPLYKDYFGPNINVSNYGIEGFNFYDNNTPAAGEFSILWTGGDRYSALKLDFIPDKDLSKLLASGFLLELWIRGETPGSKLDIRFLDTKTENPDDHPWRMGVTIDESFVTWDNNWHKIQIPLSELVEKGAWDNNQWYNPEGKFDWHSIDLIEIVAEHHSIDGRSFGFDDMVIIDTTLSATKENQQYIFENFRLYQNYPNPFNPETSIIFSLPASDHVTLSIYNIMGELMTVLIDKNLNAGEHVVQLNAEKLKMASGIYIYSIKSSLGMRSKKMIYLK